MASNALLRRQYDEMVSENARLTEELAAAQARAECLKALERRVARLEREAGKCYCMNCIVIG